jgi:hypothetical protein
MGAVANVSLNNGIRRLRQLFRWVLLARLAIGAAVTSSLALAQEAPVAGFVPGTDSRSDVKPFYFAVPAPRGQILDRQGRPLAQNTTLSRLQLTVPAAQRSTLETYTAWLEKALVELSQDAPAARMPTADQLKRHFEDRRELPVTVSDALPIEVVFDAKKTRMPMCARSMCGIIRRETWRRISWATSHRRVLRLPVPFCAASRSGSARAVRRGWRRLLISSLRVRMARCAS